MGKETENGKMWEWEDVRKGREIENGLEKMGREIENGLEEIGKEIKNGKIGESEKKNKKMER